MMKPHKMFLFVAAIFVLYSGYVFAAEGDKLIISEVHPESIDSQHNWIEVYNPTDIPLNLFQFRMYHVWTRNLMPAEYSDTIVNPGDFAIICTNRDMFQEVSCKIIQIEFFSPLYTGGYILIGSKKDVNDEDYGEGYLYDAVRYGDPTITDEYKDIAEFGEFVAQFTQVGYSYQIIEPFTEKQYIFAESTPGEHYSGGVGVDENSGAVHEPKEYTISAFPNPFNPTTTISYTFADHDHVTLSVYNLAGQKVATLVDSPMPAGTHQSVFNGAGLASGMYFYRFEAGDVLKTGKMMLMK